MHPMAFHFFQFLDFKSIRIKNAPITKIAGIYTLLLICDAPTPLGDRT